MPDRTKDRILRAASNVFSRRGLKNATVREICDLAGANVAAINYYFSGKERLYIHVIKSYISEMESSHPVDEDITEASTPEDMLRAFIKNMLCILADDSNPVHRGLGKIIAHEFMEPSDIHGEIIDSCFTQKFEYLQNIILRIYPQGDTHFGMRASATIIGQCILIAYASGLTIKIGPGQLITSDNLDQMAAFLVEFSLGGLARLNELVSEDESDPSSAVAVVKGLGGVAAPARG